MAVVTVYGSGYKNPSAFRPVDAVFAEAKVFAINSIITITNGDSIASNYFVGRIPSNAIILPLSRIDTAAITSVTSAHLGFAAAGAQLVSAQTLAAAAQLSAVSAVTAANLNKQVWALAGFTSDPGGMIDIVLTINAAATATGQVVFTIFYARR